MAATTTNDDNAANVVIDGSIAAGGDKREVEVDSDGNTAVPPGIAD